MKLSAYIFSFVFLIAIAGVFFFNREVERNVKEDFSSKQKGVCWVGGRQIVTTNEIETAKKCGINWISQTPFGWQQQKDSPVIQFEKGTDHNMWWGESTKGITTTTELALQVGIKSMLKPHLWVHESWPGEIKMKTEEDWKMWFNQYTDFMLHYAALAEKLKIEILCIGTELHQTITHETEWRMLITKVRTTYHGKLIYAANFNEEYEQVKFWDALDYIGIQAYFPLTKKENVSVKDLAEGWSDHLSDIEKTQRKFNKPVIFTEIGYKSTTDAAIEPWKWPEEADIQKASDQTQSNCYEAFFLAAWNKEWLEGVYFWKWYPQGGHGRFDEADFTPQGKEAEKVMAEWFAK